VESPSVTAHERATGAGLVETAGRRRRAFIRTIGLWPLIGFLAVFFLFPLLRVTLESVHFPGLSLKEYLLILSDPVQLRVFGNTFRIAAGVTILTVLLGYPLAYALCHVGSPKLRALLLICVLLPLLTSFLVRTYAWMVLLQRQGVINQILINTGLITEPLALMYNRTGTFIGMTHVLLPFMVLPLYSVMRNINPQLLEAASNLGATPFRAFVQVFVPLSLPGVAAGMIFVFMLALGFFITPALLGGGPDITIAVLIERQATQLLNWPLASALATVLLLLSLVLYVLYDRLLGLERLFGSLDSR
jgi:putative spermidine/putrescine transport system permease protein